MATQQLFLVCDNSTLANFKSWAQSISSWFSTCGWTQSSDTGQVNWSTIVSVPGSGAYVYEIWKPGDGLKLFYVKVEYGNVSGTNCPTVQITIGDGSNGSGTITSSTGSLIGPTATNAGAYTVASSSLTYECNFSGDSGRMCFMLWRTVTNNACQVVVIERSLNSTGTYYGTSSTGYVTLVTGGNSSGNNSTNPSWTQRSYVFGVGASNTIASRSTSSSTPPQVCVRSPAMVTIGGSGSSSGFNGGIPFDTVSPMVGFFDFPMTGIGVALGNDVVEGVPFTVTLYGSSRTYVPTKANILWTIAGSSATHAACMRYD